MKIIILIILSILSGIAYRLGGIGKPFKTWMRDGICPLIALVALWLLVGFKSSYWWAYLLHFGLLFGALTTYWKKKGADAYWYNWLLTGLGYSLSAIPIAWISGHWVGFLLRTIILSGAITLWSVKIGNAKWEERGRGFAIIITLPLLLI